MNQKKYKLTRIGKTGFEKKIDESRFAINYQHELNPSQYQAVAAVNGAYLIIAGAGTGKFVLASFSNSLANRLD